MPHGQPDYGSQAAKETVFGQADLGELAVRLGSIVSYDRRGDVIWLDDFESDVFKWRWRDIQLGGSVVASAAAARSGGFSAKMTTPGALVLTISMIRGFPYPVVGNFGYEISFTVDANHDYIDILSYLYDGTNYKRATIRLNVTNSRLEYESDAPAFVPFAAGINPYQNIYMFHTLKMVVDWVNNKYVRALFANTEYDLSAHSIYTFGSGVAPHLEVGVVEATAGAAAVSGYVDNVIVTQNEP